MVPNGWTRVPIKEVCHSIIDCVNKTAPVVDYETPYKMIRTSNVRNGRVNTFDVRYVTKETYEQWTRRGAPLNGDVILTREAPVGEVGILENAEGIFLGQRLMMYRANKKIADNYYLFYSLSSAFCQKQIEDYSNGGTVAHMRVPDCGEILVNLPPLLEQQKIAQVLLTWDQAISATEKLLENIQQQKKALMQQLLTGKKRLLDKNGGRFSATWLSKSLKDISKVSIGLVTTMTEHYVESGIPLIRNSDIKENRITKEKLIKLSEDFANQNSGRKLSKGDVVTVHTGEVGVSAVIDDELDGCLGFATLNTRPNKKIIDAQFLCWYFNSSRFIAHCISLSTGDGRQNLNLKDFSKVMIPVPSLLEQKKIASALSLAAQEMETLQKRLDCLKQEKKALMQQLLTGKKRVKVAA